MSIAILSAAMVMQAPITLKFQPKVGSTYKHQVTISMSGGPMGSQPPTTMTSSSKVLSFTNGKYRVETTTSGGQKPMKMVSLISPDGSSTPEKTEGMPKGMSSMFGAGKNGSGVSVQFPKKPIKVGDSWSETMDLGKMMGEGMKQAGPGVKSTKSDGKLTISNKLVSVSGGKATIRQTISGSADMGGSAAGGKDGKAQSFSMKMGFSGGGDVVIDIATGIMISSTMKQNMSMNMMGQPMNMVMNMTMKKI